MKKTLLRKRTLTSVPNTDDSSSNMQDFFASARLKYEQFNEKAWAKGKGYGIPGYPVMEQRLEGLESGLYLFAGESNSGKSGIMMNLIEDIAQHEENCLTGVYYSLDDSAEEIIARVIAMKQMIPISVASKPQRYQEQIDDGAEGSALFEDWLEKREDGLKELMDSANKFIIEDATVIRNSSDLYEHMKKIQTYVKAQDPNNNIIVAFDSVNDIRLSDYRAHSTEDKHAETAKTIKEWAVQMDIPIFASCHLRKLNGNRRPTLDDLKYSQEYVYESSVTFLVHNDVSKNKEAAQIYYEQDGFEEKRPVIEIDWAKNKKSSYKGRTYNFFIPESSRTRECDDDTIRQYDTLIYEL